MPSFFESDHDRHSQHMGRPLLQLNYLLQPGCLSRVNLVTHQLYLVSRHWKHPMVDQDGNE